MVLYHVPNSTPLCAYVPLIQWQPPHLYKIRNHRRSSETRTKSIHFQKDRQRPWKCHLQSPKYSWSKYTSWCRWSLLFIILYVTPFHYLETSTIIALSNQKTYSEISEFNQENDGFITSIHVIHISKNAASNIIKMMWTEMMELIKMAIRQ